MLSPLAARKAEKLGYTNVKTFRAGLPEWRKLGHPVVSNIAAIDDFIKNDASYILLDLRPKNLMEQGHIPKAVAVPEKGIDDLKDQFPKFKGAAIILYNQDGNVAAATEAFKKISDWGYKQVSILIGGFEGWQKAGKEIAKGPAESKITYVRKLMPGETEVSVLRELIAKPSEKAIILDVRNIAEFNEGSLPNARNIPLDDLEQRLAELPKDKKIVVHCATGARAEMGYNILKKGGLDVGYVKAKVDFDKENKGKYTIEE